MQTLGERLTHARKARGLTQEQLAESMHCSRQAISHWETGRSQPDVESLAMLNQLLGCDLLNCPAESAAPAVTPEPAPEPPVAPEPPAAASPARPFNWRYLVLFLSGAIVMCVLMLLLMPKPSQTTQLPTTVLSDLSAAYDTAWFRAEQTPKAGHSHLRISAESETIPLLAYEQFPNGIGWLFDITITEIHGIDFTITDITYTYFPSHTLKCPPNFHFHDESLYAVLGQDHLQAGSSLVLGCGLPYQPLVGLGVCVQGYDAKGQPMEFRQYFPFEQKVTQEN